MNHITILVGVVTIGYGLYIAWARRAKPEQFKKLEPMKKAWGERSGHVVHVIGYTVVPIVIGAVLVWRGLQGGSLF